MNVFHRYTRQALRKNRSRTWVTIVGIILSVALFTAVTEGAYSGVQYLVGAAEYTVGRFHGCYQNLTEQQASQLSREREITKKSAWQIVPGDVAEVVRGYLEYVSGNASRQLMWFSLVFSIWFPMRATGCLLHSLRKAFGKGQPKNILLDQLKIFLFAIWLMVSIGLTLLMITVGRRALYFVSGIITVPDGFINLWSKLRFVAVALLMFVLVTVLYMLALGRRCPLREVAPGVAVSLAAWMLLSLAFSYYVENLAHYTQLYGSIATIVVVLLWLYMSGTVLILGGELNAVVLHRRTQRRRAAEEKAAERAARLPQGRFSIFGESGTVFRCPCQSVDRLASLILNLDIQVTGLNFVDTGGCGVGEPCESSAYQHSQAQNHSHDAAQQGPFGTLAVCHNICLLFFAWADGALVGE